MSADLEHFASLLCRSVDGLSADSDITSELESARIWLMDFDHRELPVDCVERTVKLKLSLGLSLDGETVPVPSPWDIRELPVRRREELAKMFVWLLRDVAFEAGKAAVGKPSPVFGRQRLGRVLLYSHLGWDGYGQDAGYHRFLEQAFPDYPTEVIGQWLARNGSGAFSLFGDYLPYERLTFRQEVWRNSRITTIRAHDASFREVGADSYGAFHLAGAARSGDQHWLPREMVRLRGWPTPIIVLDDGRQMPRAQEAVAGQPYLLEGHRRLALYLNMMNQGIAADEQAVWVARVAEEVQT